jgi:hypothetical protein
MAHVRRNGEVKRQRLQCCLSPERRTPIEWLLHSHSEMEWLFYVVWWASRSDELAKRESWELLATDRKRIILAKLRDGNVRPSDAEDAHHNIILKVYERIEQLKTARSYRRWEERVIHEECGRWRRDYAILIGPVEMIEEFKSTQAK